MGEWKAQVSIRIRQGTRAEIEGFAARERRTMSNVSELLLECGIAHLKTAGSIEQLVRTLPRAEQFGGDSGSAQRPKDKEPSCGRRNFRSLSASGRHSSANSKKWRVARSIPSVLSPRFCSNGAMNSSRPSARRSDYNHAGSLSQRIKPNPCEPRRSLFRRNQNRPSLPEYARMCGRE
jgi:hypothetical protein